MVSTTITMRYAIIVVIISIIAICWNNDCGCVNGFTVKIVPVIRSSSSPSSHYYSNTKTTPPQCYNGRQHTSLYSIDRRSTFIPIVATAITSICTGLDRAIAVDDTKTSVITNDDSTTISPGNNNNSKKLNLSNQELIEIIKKDIIENQFLVTGKVTRSIYSDGATFTDEIDTYPIEKWIIGTQRLFIGNESHVNLIGDIIIDPTNENNIIFYFDEILTFNIPLLKPVVPLTGKVVLTRDPSSGYVTSYREYWDQDIQTVLKSIHLF